MNLLKKILVPTDFSPAADNAAHTAGFVARQFGSQLCLLHIKSKHRISDGGDWSDIDQLISQRLTATEDRLRSQGVENIESQVVEGTTFEEIERIAKDRDVNVIITGGGEATSSGQVYLGATAARLRQKSSKPIWIVKPGDIPPIHRILCPVDYSPVSARALRNAIHLARGLQAVLTVLTVKPSLADEYEGLIDSEDSEDDIVRARLPEFEDFLRGFDFHKVHWRCMARRGKPQHEIPKVAREIRSHLLVMGSAGRSGVSRMLIGGVARRVAQEMPCSILTIRQEDPIHPDADESPQEPRSSECEATPAYVDCARHTHGQELLEQGFADEAISHFEDCIAEYAECPRAWESMAQAHARLGHTREARVCKERADQIRQKQLNQQIQDEIRGRYTTYRDLFGIEYE